MKEEDNEKWRIRLQVVTKRKQDETQFDRMTFDDNRESFHVLLCLCRSYFHSLSHYLSFLILRLSLSLSLSYSLSFFHSLGVTFSLLYRPSLPLYLSLSIALRLFLSFLLSVWSVSISLFMLFISTPVYYQCAQQA